MSMLERLAGAGLLALPAALTVALSFSGGGFFVGPTAVAALVVVVVLVLRMTLAERPLAGFTRVNGAAAVALALFAAWTLASAAWSGAPSRALLEFDRALLYLLVFVLYASIPHSSERLAWLVRAVAAGLVLVCAASLTTRVAPDFWPISANVSNDRLSYPITYWNALGLLAAAGTLLCLHLSAAEHEPAAARVGAAAALPLVASTLLLTFSRGAIGAGAIGVVVYLAFGRPRALLGALLAAVPAAIAVHATYGAELVQSSDFAAPAAVEEGHGLGVTIALCMVAAGLVRVVALPLDRRLIRLSLPAGRRRPVLIAATGLAIVVALSTLAAVDAPAEVGRQYDRFVEGRTLRTDGDLRGRLTDPANNGRLDHWDVALGGFRSSRLNGSGAGTYQLLWARERPSGFTVVDGHSLYVEVLGELGLVGLALLVIALATILVALARRTLRRGRQGGPYAAALAAIVVWVVHAGFDWDWEMPAVTLWMLALAGLALAAPRGRRRLDLPPSRTARVVTAVGLLALAVTPALAASSQRHLDRSVEAFVRGDCERAADAALDSIESLSMRPEPWELLGYCDLRLGEPELAQRALRHAIRLDPDNWEFRYGLALVRGASGRDPRRAARAALRRNPRDPLARAAVDLFDTDDPREWRERALRAPLPLPVR